MTETTEPATPASALTDQEILTALCYVDAKAACAVDGELSFPQEFARAWGEMKEAEAEDAASETPVSPTLPDMCQWFRQGLTFPNPMLVPLGDPS